MGNRVTCSTTPENVVEQGGANTPLNHCSTTLPLKGGRVVVERLVVSLRWWSRLVGSGPSTVLRKGMQDEQEQRP